MDLELWLPAWQPDRILEYPELEGATGFIPSNPTLCPTVSQQLDPGMLEQGRN